MRDFSRSKMLQPRISCLVFVLLSITLVELVQGFEYSNPARRRREDNDLRTVLLVDSNGKQSIGRHLNVRPDLGLLTSTARTFIKDGVKTEYATQVLGTTLDDGHLYAHLLTKTSRVIYDDLSPTKIYDSSNENKKYEALNPKYIKNLDFISPNAPDAIYVFPTITQNYSNFISSNQNNERQRTPQEIIHHEEILKESPSNNFRVPFEDKKLKVLKIGAQRDSENFIFHKEDGQLNLNPSKVTAWENLPTFTVRNEFSPSGFSYLGGDLPEFDSRTERSKLTTPSKERKAKLLFKAGLIKPNPKDLETVTYKGFADFTTTVANTVIIFTPNTPDNLLNTAEITKIAGEATIKPTVVQEKPLFTNRPAYTTAEQAKPSEEIVEIQKPGLREMVIDKNDRKKSQTVDEPIDLDAKYSVLANEQKSAEVAPQNSKANIVFTKDIIQPSETTPVMLSTPSDEDIAKILASLQAQANQHRTEPLSSAATVFFDKEVEDQFTMEPKKSSGAKTIFFDEDPFSFEPSATQKAPDSTIEPILTERPTSTTEKVITTTEKEEETTTQEIPTTTEQLTTTPEQAQNEIESEAPQIIETECKDGKKIVPSSVYKTLTYLTTFYIPLEGSTSTSVKSNKVVSTQVNLHTLDCEVEPSKVETTTEATQIPSTEPMKTTTEPITTTIDDVDEEDEPTTVHETTTLPEEITTERRHVTESEPETTEATTEEGDEIELIFKTLYTTYTYLTTYFQESTSSVASRIVVTTNVITSTLEPGSESTEDAISGLLDEDETPLYKSKGVSFEDLAGISPTNVINVLNTATQEDNHQNEYLENNDKVKATPALDDSHVSVSGLKTFYTTYTYFTTIFVDDETKISSRTEVYTNYVTPTPVASQIKSTELIQNPDQLEASDDDQLVLQNKLRNIKFDTASKYNSINRQKVKENKVLSNSDEITKSENNDVLDLTDYEAISTMVTDVRSSTSRGERRILDSGEVDKRNVLLDDQIVSESNNDSEIIPSPTLLLQTSFTTFTYYTTLYHGTTASDVVSRLETVTNVVTQTLEPTQTLSTADQTLPITYFTTFTYWTTLYKDGLTRVTSREETVSNVVTPSIEATAVPDIGVVPLITKSVGLDEIIPSTTNQNLATQTIENLTTTEEPTTPIVPSQVGDDDLTTFFTTYTYYTTSYVDDQTILNSRLETVTNVVNKTNEIEDNQIGRSLKDNAIKNQITDPVKKELEKEKENIKPSSLKPTGLLSTIVNTVENNGTFTVLSTDVYGTYINGLYAKVLESTSSILKKEIEPSSIEEQSIKPTGIVSINQGKIIDADGISTLLYTTQAIGTVIDGHYAQVIESTSSLAVDQEKKSALGTDVLPVAQRTGLVRLIEGSIIANQTTTLYQSKVLGTFIDGRYAQIIESTSSFLLPSIKPTKVNEIVPTSTQAPGDKVEATAGISPSPVVIEGSLSDISTTNEENSTESNDEEDEDGKSKSRLSFQPKKNNFTPAIRPFSSRARPAFAPKRTRPGITTAATITRSDFTPTVTAVPASKSGRFGARRSSAANINQIQATTSSSRRFSRPKATAQVGGRRPSSSARINSISSTGTRRSGFRTSASTNSIRPSASNRFGLNRIRPTGVTGLNRSPSSKITTEVPLDEENDLTTVITDGSNTETGNEAGDTTLPIQTTTESARRNNPLLRFRRPPVSRAPPSPRTSTARTAVSRGGSLGKASTKSASTTTPKPRTTRASTLLNRNRNNNLFPRRNLFTTTTTPAPEEENEAEEENEEGLEEEDTDYDTSLYNTQTEKAPTTPSSRGRNFNQVQIKPFGFRRRSKRDTYSRFRRPTSRTTTVSVIDYDYVEEITAKPLFRNRYQPKYQRTTAAPSTTPAPQTRKRISPTRSSTSRTQFTLREKDTSPSRQNFNRRSETTNTRRTTANPRLNTRFRNSYNSYQTEPTVRRTTASSRTRSRSRVNTRGRGNFQNDNFDENNIIPKFDGTLTITYQIPTEATIPVVNGKVTEYKNIVTAKLSTEVVGPRQYSTSIGPFGKEQKVLLTENTSINPAGATLITQYVLNEQPTSSVIFTPTYIRGRKTKYSHVIPSTVYQVEEIVNTIQPALAAQAPLANILLSQLLLGGGVAQNPLLALQNQNAVQPTTPVTEFKTRTTTYVTTLTSTLETVIPITFRAQQILTTIVDSSIKVVTATEYITDTIVVTPTINTQSQLNTLLLPLLQQQLQQQPLLSNQLLQQQNSQNLQTGQTPSNVFNLNDPQQQLLESDIESEESNLAIDESEENQSKEVLKEEALIISKRKNTNKKVNKLSRVIEESPKETSVVTLYVSGRTPGEFTTLLSTITLAEDSRNKREAELEVKPSGIVVKELKTTLDYFDRFLIPGTKESSAEIIDEVSKETQSLESIIGDVSKHLKTKSDVFSEIKPSKSTKKYKISLNDLSSLTAPEDAKVETSQQPRGNNVDLNQKNNNQINVSKLKSIGSKINSANLGHAQNSNLKLISTSRKKRDVNINEDSIGIGSETSDKPRRRVIKKLIRKNPMQTNNLTKSVNVPRSIQSALPIQSSDRKRRRRVKIKKKKKRISLNGSKSDTSLANLDEEHEQQATKPRRKVVITRKRVLPNRDKTTESIIKPSVVKYDAIQPTTFRRDGYVRKLKLKSPEMMAVNDSTEISHFEQDDKISVKDGENLELNNAEDDEEDDAESFEGTNYDDDSEGDEDELEQEPDDQEDTEDEYEEFTVPTFQNLPEYEPSFPELTQPFDEPPILPLITTTLSSVELQTRTIETTQDKTYTFLIITKSGDKDIEAVTSEVRPEIHTLTTVESVTSYQTLTLLKFEDDQTDTPVLEQTETDIIKDETTGLLSNSIFSILDITPTSSLLNTKDIITNDEHEEGRNLATRVMSNGVEVIVKGDKASRQGDPDIKKGLTSPNNNKPVTLKASTLTEHMMLAVHPKETISLESETPSLYPNQFIVKTCLTTFTYLTTYLEKGQTTVHSHEKVVSNVATEDRLNTGKILPTPQVQVTLTQYPNLNVGVFHTTYSYINTILDGEQPLVLSSKHVVTNHVTAPDDYLALLHPTETEKPVRDTNTYFSTINLEKTLYEDGHESVISTRELVTQVVITESIRPKQTEVIQIDDLSDLEKDTDNMLTTDIVRTQFVTYTYYNTLMEDGNPKIYTNISTEKNLVTEKMYMKSPQSHASNYTEKDDGKKSNKDKDKDDTFDILTTKTYLTTFTYFTTLLQEENPVSPTIIHSRTKVIENVATETLDHNMFDDKYLKALKNEIKSGGNNIKKIATLLDGQKVEITAVVNGKLEIMPSKVLSIEKTEMPQTTNQKNDKLEGSFTNTPNIITGSTIIFTDDDPFANFAPTPNLDNNKPEKTPIKNTATILNSEVVKETKISVHTSKVKRPGNKNKNKTKNSNVNASKVQQSVSTDKVKTHNEKTENKKKTQNQKIAKPGNAEVSDLLGLGSININTLQALTPVLSAMAGYINKNLIDTNRRSDNFTNTSTIAQTTTERFNQLQVKKDQPPAVDTQNRSPVYIPVGGIAGDDFEIAESQNIANFDWIDQIPSNSKNKVPQEAPLLSNGIPISPGDIITANSDVIVGKIKGRIGPRIPSNIPLHNHEQNEIPLGMKPPPLPNKNRPVKKGNQQAYNNIENLGNGIRKDKPIVSVVHAPNKDDYVGPPPPPQQQKYEKYTGDKRKHIPLHIHSHQQEQHSSGSQYSYNYKSPQENPIDRNPNKFNSNIQHGYPNKPNEPNFVLDQSSNFGVYEMKPQPQNVYTFNQQKPVQNNQGLTSFSSEVYNRPQIYAQSHFNVQSAIPQQNLINYATNEVLQEQNMPNLKESIQKHYQAAQQKNSYPPVYAQAQDIAPSVPIVLPEIVERKTGQPLLVHIQPSQVAFVNIPFNRTTALIYGGSTEPHHSGQYFDDPSPYPQPEFSAIENPHNSIFASGYNDDHLPNQKQVSGVITVGHQPIRIDPDSSGNQNVQIRIDPSRPNNINNIYGKPERPSEHNKIYGNQEINVSVGRPSLSFGMTENHGELQAHIIDHYHGNNSSMSNLWGEVQKLPHPYENNFNIVGAQNLPYSQQNTFNIAGVQNLPYLQQSNFNFAQTESSLNPQKYTHPQITGNKRKPQFSMSLGTHQEPSSGDQNQQYLNKFTQTESSLNQKEVKFNQGLPQNQKSAFSTQQELQNQQQNINSQFGTQQNLPLREKAKPFRPQVPHAQKKKYPHPPKRTLLRGKPRPGIQEPQISEFMVPPPLNQPQNRPYNRLQTKKPVEIPLLPELSQKIPEVQQNNQHGFIQSRPQDFNNHEVYSAHNSQEYSYNQRKPEGHTQNVYSQGKFGEINNSNGINQNKPAVPNVNKYHSHNIYKEVDQSDSELFGSESQDGDDDLTNEDGEVIQESNSRPLLPGEVPFEILKEKTPHKPSTMVPYDFVRFPYENETRIELPDGYDRPPVLPQRPQIVRPFKDKNANGHQRPVSIEVPLLQDENISEYNRVTSRPQYHTTRKGSAVETKIIKQTLQGEVVKQEPTLTNQQKRTTQRPRNTQIYEFGTRTTPFDIKTKVTRRNSSTTQKPVLIFIDENGQQQSFLNRHKDVNRPKVTSLPIDHHLVNAPHHVSDVSVESNNPNSQTEKAFVMPQHAQQPTNQVDIPLSDTVSLTQKVQSTTKKYTTTQTPTFTTTVQQVSPALNTGEIPLLNLSENLTKEINDLEVMKPPPPYIELVRPKPHKPNTKMEPPKIEFNSPGDILKVPALADTQLSHLAPASSPKPPTPKAPSEEMAPPPLETITEVVLGMTPPPLSSTHKPLVGRQPPPVTHIKPDITLEVDVPPPKEITTKRNRGTRPTRLPFTRRPGYRRTTTTQVPYRETTPNQQSTIRQIFTGFPKRSTTQKYNKDLYTTSERPQSSHEIKTPSVAINDEKPNMEVFIGHPTLKPNNKNILKDDTTNNINKESGDSLEADSNVNDINATPVLTKEGPINIITTPVHHAGNEVKVVDDTTSPLKVNKDVIPSKDLKKVILPTRYITHTKTMTVTITKTTVVKTSGLPPSTMTILVTKTEKSYIIDTVTEFHTLVKPTSVTETITHTVEASNSLYDNNVYGSGYHPQINPSISIPHLANTEVIESTFVSGKEEEMHHSSMEDFIITETDSPEVLKEDISLNDNDSIFIVMTDKNNKGSPYKIPGSTNAKDAIDSIERDEISNNEIHNNIVLGGILSANHPIPSHSEPTHTLEKANKCNPECKNSMNEVCQSYQGIRRCMCRPGFARMFPDRPCNPTYTYSLNLTIDRLGDKDLNFDNNLSTMNSSDFTNLARRTHEALDRMVMQSDLRDVYHGVQVRSFEPSGGEKGVVSRFYLQLSDNIDETRLEDVFRKYLRNNNYSLGGTEVYASSRTVDGLRAQDFNECSNAMFNDCSKNARCFNLRGTYTCSCREGYSDLSENMLYPGRVCSAEKVGCERCNYHGTCNVRNGLEFRCECFHWYAGDSCHINLKALLIALVTLGLILFLLLTICLIMTCVKKKPKNAAAMAAGMSFLPQKAGGRSGRNDGTLDRRAMIDDTSSEDSRSERNSLPPYVQQKPPAPKQKPPAPPSQTQMQMKPALKKTSKISLTSIEQGETGVIFPDQKDRSLTVMIPRAKYHPAPPTSPLMNYTTFDARKPSVPNGNEAKLLAYLDAGPSPNKTNEPKRRVSNSLSESYIEEQVCSSRKTSGALVSAGFEVSATVVNNMGTLGTTCGTEADRSENATLIQKISADLLSSVDGRSQYTERIRKDSSVTDDDIASHSNWTGIPRIATISESRSLDETTIPPPMKSFRSDYDSKSSHHHNDEANTMAERDLGSTFLLPHTHLYKPDRGSDVGSGFESL